VITWRRLPGCFVLLLLLTCKEPRTAVDAPREGSEGGCIPTFHEISPDSIHIKAGTWRIDFSIVLIGCKDTLESLTPTEVEAIGHTLATSPQELALWLFVDPSTPELRKAFAQRINYALGREVAADVLIYQVVVNDNLQPYD